MNTLPVILAVLCIFALAYRYYSAFLAAKALALDDRRVTPAHAHADGHNYVASPKWVLFGHHFAAIAGAGPLVGPTLAAQFGFAPGFVWILFGAVLAGSVQDFTVLFWPLTHTPGKEFQGYLDISLMLIFITGVIVVVAGAARRCLATLRGDSLPAEAAGPPVVADGPKLGCC